MESVQGESAQASVDAKKAAQNLKDARAVLYAYPPFVYVWPIIVMGFAFWFTDRYGWLSPGTEAWIYSIVVVVILLTMGMDINRNMAVFWLVVIAAVWLGILWLRDARGFLVFGRIGQFFADLNPRYSPDLGMLMSIFLGVLYVLMIATARINDKWIIGRNEIEHIVLFRGSSSLGRGAKGVKASFRDTFELVLLLAGDIEVRTAQGNRVLARIGNVPFLWLRMRKIDRILAAYAMTPGADEEAGEEEVL